MNNKIEDLLKDPNRSKEAKQFLHEIYGRFNLEDLGDLENRWFKPSPQSNFSSDVNLHMQLAFDLCKEGIDVYYGVNPRQNQRGKKENIKYVTAFHAEVDYGKEGHKKPSEHETREEALEAINNYKYKPSIIVESGHGFHVYYLLDEPAGISKYGVEYLESINKALLQALKADPGTHNLDRVLRIPGTINWKYADNPKPVKLIHCAQAYYSVEDFDSLIKKDEAPQISQDTSNTKISNTTSTAKLTIDDLQITDKIKDLIINGNNGSYTSRSEADMAVVSALVNKGIAEESIKGIFKDSNYKIGDKYREHSKPDQYLNHTINKARELSDLTEDELLNPLFTSGSINKAKKKLRLDAMKYQEYITSKYTMKYFENTFYKYSGKCYDALSSENLNNLCQKELGDYRKLFTQGDLKSFVHYSVGDIYIEEDKIREDQVNYLTLQNGLFDLSEYCLIPHNKDIFTTNLLPYDYDPKAECPRFMQYLNEVFLEDKEIIEFIQEAVGYAFHKKLPIPAIFFLIGIGSNGKSVFIDIITSLYGESNTSSISLNSLTNEYYLLELHNKMINVSSETPTKRQFSSDIIKQIVAGDMVTGRQPHQLPKKFKPYAKHYLAMNETPSLEDNTHGMNRRIYLIEFPKVFSKEEMDTDLTQKLLNELPGIFNWALEGYRRLKDREFKFNESKSMVVAKHNYQNKVDSVYSFINDKLDISETNEDEIKFGDLFQNYELYCLTEGYRNDLSKKEFKGKLIEKGIPVKKSTKHGNHVYAGKVRYKQG
ncbi:hypothetical protein KAR91_22230 [Candidatus Pacearchaeota archaeon]|nr:hypothetical protein [Candidatus Pacearchaeota archaeon]